MSLLEKLKKSSTIKHSSVLVDSCILLEKDNIKTPVPAINIALSGSINGGLTSGMTVFAGKSKHFKSTFALLLAQSYLEKYPESVLLFYDNEFGSPISYFESLGINPDRVFHTPITNIEELKHDISNQLKGLERGDKVIIVVDSIGNLASVKEVEDALDGRQVADMTRAKQIKSLCRIVTSTLTLKDIPMVVIAHTYDTLEMYSKAVVSGGTGIMYSPDNVYIIGRNQEKEGTEIVGYNFIINVEKSRFVREKSKIPISVTHDNGINLYSGLLDIALDVGFVTKPKNGWYAKVNVETGEVQEKNYRESQTNSKEFWDEILSNPKFDEAVIKKYRMANNKLINIEESKEEIQELYNDPEL
jgi:RecA/RadA recombinase